MPELIAPLPHLSGLGQEAIHRPLGAEISALIEERSADLGGGEIHEAWLVEHGEHGGTFLSAEGSRRG
jgi:hypothetical protein